MTLKGERSKLARVRGAAYVGEHLVAEMDLLLAMTRVRTHIHPSAVIYDGAEVGEGSTIGPNAVIGAHVKLGPECKVGANAVIDGWTTIGEGTEVFPFASIGLIPQDLKFKGEKTTLSIGKRNVFREFVTVHRGTAGGGGATVIGDRNVFMAYAHVAHDSKIGNDTIFGNNATLGGHVTVEDFATISAGSGVHQFCRVGRHAFIGGYSVVTKDALPFAKTVGNRAKNLRVEHDRADPPRHAGGRRGAAAPCVPAAARVEAEYHARARADRAGSRSGLRGSAIPRRLHPQFEARGRPAPRHPPARRARRRLAEDQRHRVTHWLDRRQRPVSVSRARRRAAHGP